MGRVSKQSGFTIVELVVTMVVSTIVVSSVIGAVAFFITNSTVTSARNRAHTDLQSSLQKIASYIRSSDNVLLSNWGPDDNAPSSKQGESASVPGPDSIPADDNYRYYWRSTSNQLVMAQPSRNGSGSPIYTNPAGLDFSGPRDSIVLYIKDGALYARMVYTSQSASTTLSCGGTTIIGGCSGDIKIVDNIKMTGTTPSFTVTYYDGAGVAIPATIPDGSGGTLPNYNARKLSKSVKIELTLESIVNNRKVAVTDSSVISFRTGFVPGATVIGSNNGAGVGTGTVAPPWSMAGNMYAGPGGLSTGYGTITGTGLNVIGKMTVTSLAHVGTPTAPMTVTVGNLACPTPSWPALCGTEPITGLFQYGGAIIYGNVCATGQTTNYNMTTTGLQPGCTAPPIVLPSYDRQAFLDSMKTQQPSNTGSCSFSNFTPKTWGPDVVYNGSLTSDFLFCSIKVKGNIYVKGDITSDTLLSMTVDESVGLKRPIVVVEGTINFNTIGQSIIPNSYGTGVDFISYKSSNTNCLTTPTCQDRSNLPMLYNSHNQPTINISSLSAVGSTFYAYYGRVNVDGFANVGAVSGQTVNIGWATISGS